MTATMTRGAHIGLESARRAPTAPPSAVLSLENVHFYYGRRAILSGLDLAIGPGQSVAIQGRSGAGKSTLLSLVAGLLRPKSGNVRVLDVRISRLRLGRLARFRRRHLGIVFQAGELLPSLSAAENVAMPLLLDGAPWEAADGAARELLRDLGVACESHDLAAASLSGGERQRTALARGLVIGPELIVADEPTGALDARTRDDVADLLFAQPRSRGCALLVVTHDEALAARADAQFALCDGELRPAGGARR